jgi:7-cyano-7-deazaguanine synthase
MNEAMGYGTYKHVNIYAPYTTIDKKAIAKIGKALGIDYSKTWTCYKGRKRPCGKCGSCVERQEALA